jgi:hypothetical protein
MDRLAFQCPRSDTGSISAPARNVSTSEPALARNVTRSVEVTCCWIPGMLPASAPTTISTSAAGTAILMLTTEASRAMPTQIAVT